MSKAAIVIADGLDQAGIEVLEHSGMFDLVVLPVECERTRLLESVRSCEGLIVRSSARVDAELIEACERLRVLGRAGVGTDNIDVQACTARGITVMNTPLGNVTAAAEHTMAMMLALARNIPQADRRLRGGEWAKSELSGSELDGKVLGVIGLGRIGTRVAHAARAFGMKVIACDPYVSHESAVEREVELADLDRLLELADFLTLHVPATDRTRGMIGYEQLCRMKPTARVINCARGGVLDEDGLLRALKEKRIAGAAMDVFSREPITASPLFDLPNVIVTPHLGASTGEAQQKVAVDIADQFVRFFKEGVALNAVNVAVQFSPRSRPYVELALNLGRVLSQTGAGRASRLEVRCYGKAAECDPHAIPLAVLTGLLEGVIEQPVNFVNVPLIAERRGIHLTESHSSESRNFSNLVVAHATGEGCDRTVAVSLFDETIPRIVRIDGFSIDLHPAPILLMMRYRDQPGMVGKMGTILGDASINIADMTVSRLNRLGEAVVVLTLDQDPPPEILKAIDEAVDAKESYLVRL